MTKAAPFFPDKITPERTGKRCKQGDCYAENCRKKVETWGRIGSHAGHVKKHCYVMLGFSLKVRGYLVTGYLVTGYPVTGNKTEYVRFWRGVTYPEGQFGYQKK